MDALRSLWRELVTPSAASEAPYRWMLIAIAHAVTGAVLAPAMSALWPAVARGLLPLGYWLIKERGDLRRGGRVADGLVDAAFVGLGGFYGPSWWPLAVLAAAAGGAVIRAIVQERTA